MLVKTGIFSFFFFFSFLNGSVLLRAFHFRGKEGGTMEISYFILFYNQCNTVIRFRIVINQEFFIDSTVHTITRKNCDTKFYYLGICIIYPYLHFTLLTHKIPSPLTSLTFFSNLTGD